MAATATQETPTDLAETATSKAEAKAAKELLFVVELI